MVRVPRVERGGQRLCAGPTRLERSTCSLARGSRPLHRCPARLTNDATIAVPRQILAGFGFSSTRCSHKPTTRKPALLCAPCEGTYATFSAAIRAGRIFSRSQKRRTTRSTPRPPQTAQCSGCGARTTVSTGGSTKAARRRWLSWGFLRCNSPRRPAAQAAAPPPVNGARRRCSGTCVPPTASRRDSAARAMGQSTTTGPVICDSAWRMRRRPCYLYQRSLSAALSPPPCSSLSTAGRIVRKRTNPRPW